MLLTVIIALIILSISLLLHYFQHFKILCTKTKIHSSRNINKLHNGIPNHSPRLRLSISQDQIRRKCRKNRCNCTLKPRDNEEFDFFPISFFYYLTFQIILCLLIITMDIISYYKMHNKLHSDLLFTYTIQTYHNIHNIKNSVFTYNHKVNLSDLTHLNGYNLVLNISDYVLIYSVMLLLTWESLFAFYKYYTTLFIVENCKLAPTKTVTIKFMIYAISFFILFNIQIHFYYYLWPVLLILHFVFNTYCTFKFSTILIARYQLFIDIEDRLESKENENILTSVYFMRRTSMICCTLQTIYLGLFIISYSANTIYYLPILWSICGSAYTFNFIRNRKYILFKIFQCKQKYKNQQITKLLTLQNRNSINSSQKKPHIDNKRFVNSHSVLQVPKTEEMTLGPPTCTVSSTVSYSITDNVPDSTPKISASQCNTPASISPTVPTVPKMKTNKALQILGISSPKSVMVKSVMVNSQSEIVVRRNRSMSAADNKYISPSPKLTARKITVSHSDITDGNRITKYKPKTIIMEMDTVNSDDENEKDTIDSIDSPTFKVPSRRLSSPSVPNATDIIRQNINNYNFNAKIQVNVDDIDFIDDDDVDDDDDDDECEYTYVDYKETNNTASNNIDINNIGDATQKETHTKNSTLKLKHQKSNSAPDVSKHIRNLSQVMGSLDLFAKYGFCSRNSINSLYELTRYQNKIQKSLNK